MTIRSMFFLSTTDFTFVHKVAVLDQNSGLNPGNCVAQRFPSFAFLRFGGLFERGPARGRRHGVDDGGAYVQGVKLCAIVFCEFSGVG